MEVNWSEMNRFGWSRGPRDDNWAGTACRSQIRGPILVVDGRRCYFRRGVKGEFNSQEGEFFDGAEPSCAYSHGSRDVEK